MMFIMQKENAQYTIHANQSQLTSPKCSHSQGLLSHDKIIELTW